MSNLTNFDSHIRCLTEWALILKEVLEERTNLGFMETPIKCLCHTARTITDELKRIESSINGVFPYIRADDKAGIDAKLVTVRGSMLAFQELVRKNITIQISQTPPEVTRRAFYVLKEVTDGKKFIVELMQATKRLVNDLLHVPECEKCSPKRAADKAADADQMDDISEGVASLMSDYICRKSTSSSSSSSSAASTPSRVFAKRSMPPSPKSAPPKRVRRIRPTFVTTSPGTSSSMQPKSPALKLLESKKKGLKGNLYQWVLWREALKGEQDRVSSVSARRNLYDDFSQ